MRTQVFFPTMGQGYIETSWQNNIFEFTWGKPIQGQTYNLEQSLSLTYEMDGWTVYFYRVDGNIVYLRNDSSKPQIMPSNALMAECVEVLMQTPEKFDKLKKWRDDAVKRLKKSVPRLKEEYEHAAARLQALDGCDFSFS